MPTTDLSRFSRRILLGRSGAAGMGLPSAAGLGRLSPRLWADEPPPDVSRLVGGIADPEIRAGVEAAIAKNLIPAAVQTAYPGHFAICADGKGYGVRTEVARDGSQLRLAIHPWKIRTFEIIPWRETYLPYRRTWNLKSKG